ncbi:hypothetical protein KHHGKMAE_1940 [Methylobacterium persicinum]|nr:hypothetical protein KHHGKMAE_1940 [Methylobacterium persicinum]
MAQKATAAKPVPSRLKPTAVSPPIPIRQAPTASPPMPPTPPKATGMALLMEMAAQIDRSEPVFPSLRNPPKKPAAKPVVDQDELAARLILEAGRIARNG